MVEPEAGQGSVADPGVLPTVVGLHLHMVVTVHALPAAASHIQRIAQRHQCAILVQAVQGLHLPAVGDQWLGESSGGGLWGHAERVASAHPTSPKGAGVPATWDLTPMPRHSP